MLTSFKEPKIWVVWSLKLELVLGFHSLFTSLWLKDEQRFSLNFPSSFKHSRRLCVSSLCLFGLKCLLRQGVKYLLSLKSQQCSTHHGPADRLTYTPVLWQKLISTDFFYQRMSRRKKSDQFSVFNVIWTRYRLKWVPSFSDFTTVCILLYTSCTKLINCSPF